MDQLQAIAELNRILRETDKFDDLAQTVKQYGLISPSEPQVVCIGGISGSGKSTLATSLAHEMGAIHINSDVVRKHRHSVALTETLPAKVYSQKGEGKLNHEAMLARGEQVLQAGLPVVFDATFMHENNREPFEYMAQLEHASFTGIWCHAPEGELRRRVAHRHEHEEDNPSDAGPDVLERMLKNGMPECPDDWTEIDSTQQPDQQLAQVRQALNKSHDMER